MNRKTRLSLAALAALLLAAALVGAGPRPQEAVTQPRHVLSGGATSATAGTVTLRGTLGQPLVGGTRGGAVALGHGFWHGATPGTDHALYVPLVVFGP